MLKALRIILGAFSTLILGTINYRNIGYNQGIDDFKPPIITGSFYFHAGTTNQGSSSLTFPTSGYKTLTVTTSNYASGSRSITVSTGSTSQTAGYNDTITIDVSNYDSVSVSGGGSQPVSATYRLIP